MKDKILGVILSGGLARRMGGGDKCLLKLGDKPLLAWVIERLRPHTADLLLNANGEAGRFAAFDLAVTSDVMPGFGGPLVGLLSAMRWAEAHRPHLTHIASVAGDTPFFPEGLVPGLAAALGLNAAHPNTIALASNEGFVQPIFGLWPVALADELEAWLRAGDNRKVLAFVAEHSRIDVDFPTTGRHQPFFNINRPEDLATAATLLKDPSP